MSPSSKKEIVPRSSAPRRLPAVGAPAHDTGAAGSGAALLDLQRTIGNRALGALLSDGWLQQGGVAAPAGEGVGGDGAAAGRVMRKAEPGAGGEPGPAAAPAATGGTPAAGVEPQGVPLPGPEPPVEAAGETGAEAAEGQRLVDDEAQAGPGQMRKGEFLAELRPAVCAAAEEGLAATGETARGCPWIDRYLRLYEGKPAAEVEADLLRYAPEARQASSARGYVAPVAARVRQSVARWAATGTMPEGLPGMSILGALGGSLMGLGGLFFKARGGGPASPANPAAVQARLGAGRPLPGAQRARMESALGHRFGGVRLHTDATAAGLSRRFNARAFTVGRHVAFGAGEYRPGTLVGDALLGHELAHVAQQGAGAAADRETVAAPGASMAALEADADRAAAGAMAAVWGPGRRAPGAVARPRLAAGLRLQRCGGAGQEAAPAQTTPAQPAVTPRSLPQGPMNPCPPEERRTASTERHCCTQSMLREIGTHMALAVPKVENAYNRLRTSPEDVAGALWQHFRVRPQDRNRLDDILIQLNYMREAMAGDQARFICHNFGDPFCGTDRAVSINCAASPVIRLCGEYDAAAGGGGAYLQGGNWTKTMIHEYAHAACPGGARILPAGQEFYRDQGPYPPPTAELAVKNADSYAWFAMEVG